MRTASSRSRLPKPMISSANGVGTQGASCTAPCWGTFVTRSDTITGTYLLGPIGSRRRHLSACRSLFGDDGEDYQMALRHYYQNGPPADWQERYVSAYASVHPWE